MKLNNIFSYILVLLMTLGITGCEGEKDLIIIDGNLPIKTSTLYMVGDATPNGWSIDSPTPLTATDEDPLVFSWEGPLNVGELKLCLTTGSWDAPFIRPVNNGDQIGKTDKVAETFAMHAGDPDNKWKVTEAGIYRLTFDLRNWTMSSTYVREPEGPVIEPIVTDNLYIVGDATPQGWNIDNPTQLEKTSDFIFVYQGPLTTGEIKACMTTGTWDTSFIRPSSDGCKINKDGVESPEFVNTTNPDNKWKVEEAGIYRLTFDLKNWTISAQYLEDYVPIRKLYMIGEATDGGWDWNKATEIEETAAKSNVFVWEGELGRGTFKAALVKDFGAPFYRPAKPNCEVSKSGVASNEMVFTTDPDDQWLVNAAGKYRLTFNIEQMTFDATYLGEDTTPDPLYMIGDATPGGWDLNQATEFTPVTDVEGEYTWTGTLKTGEFKACLIKDFSAPFYRPSSDNCQVSETGVTANDMVYTTDPDHKWKVIKEGKYQLNLNIKNMTINVKYLD